MTNKKILETTLIFLIGWFIGGYFIVGNEPVKIFLEIVPTLLFVGLLTVKNLRN